jgi:hypothetical protein
LGCDSIIILDLTVYPILTYAYLDTICSGQTYNFNGQTLNSSGTYTATVTSSLGCDSIITLDLTVIPILTYAYLDTICQNQTYSFNGQTLNTAGTYTATVPSSLGCDSIVTLYLTVHPILTYSYSTAICAGQTYNFNGQILNTSGTYTATVTSSLGCDSIITLNLQVVAIAEIVVTMPDRICADDGSFDINFAPNNQYFNALPTDYSIVFNQKSILAGFTNQQGKYSNNVQINFPTTIYPDHYGYQIVFSDANTNCTQQVENINFDILYPTSIMQQKWDDAIALRNRAYNGGYDFSGYQWYRNGTKLIGEDYSYIYLNGNTLIPGDEYSVEITRPDNTKMFSCPLIADYPKPSVSVFPTVVSTGNIITIYQTNDAQSARLWTVTGVLLENIGTLDTPVHQINAPRNSGVYLLDIQLNDGRRRAYDVIVQ